MGKFSFLGKFDHILYLPPENQLNMTPQGYIDERLDQQIAWYDRKSKINQKRYRVMKLMIITISVLIPFLAGLIDDTTAWIKIAVGLGGVMIALLEGILSLYKYQETWLEYRTTAEALKREKIMFVTQSGPYEEEKTLNHLVERAEAIMNKENQGWTKRNTAAAKKKEK